MNIVECTNVTKIYQQGRVEVTALDDVSLSIEKGSFAALAGPSGSGKTTLLNIIGGLDVPNSGQVVVDGNSLQEMTQSQLANLRLHKVGFVFQSYNLIPVLSAVENVEFVMLLQGVAAKERRERAMAILDDVGTDPDIVERLDRGELFTLGKYYMSGSLRVELHPLFNVFFTIINNMADPSGILQPRGVWDVTEDVQLIFGANVYYGRGGTEFGGFELPGTDLTNAPPNNIYLWLNYYF